MTRYLAVALPALAACAPTYVNAVQLPSLAPMVATSAAPPRADATIELWFQARPSRPFRELAEIQVTANDLHAALTAVRHEAAALGCDGAIVAPATGTGMFAMVVATCLSYAAT